MVYFHVYYNTFEDWGCTRIPPAAAWFGSAILPLESAVKCKRVQRWWRLLLRGGVRRCLGLNAKINIPHLPVPACSRCRLYSTWEIASLPQRPRAPLLPLGPLTPIVVADRRKFRAHRSHRGRGSEIGQHLLYALAAFDSRGWEGCSAERRGARPRRFSEGRVASPNFFVATAVTGGRAAGGGERWE